MATHTVNILGVSVLFAAASLAVIHETETPFFQQLDADLTAVFFNSGEFAERAPYRHRDGRSTSYRVIFDDPTAAQNMGSEGGVISFKPQVQIVTSLLLSPPCKADRITVRGCTYTVDDFTDDGVGVTTLFLARVRSA